MYYNIIYVENGQSEQQASSSNATNLIVVANVPMTLVKYTRIRDRTSEIRTKGKQT